MGRQMVASLRTQSSKGHIAPSNRRWQGRYGTMLLGFQSDLEFIEQIAEYWRENCISYYLLI
jgi:hypothetical protein